MNQRVLLLLLAAIAAFSGYRLWSGWSGQGSGFASVDALRSQARALTDVEVVRLEADLLEAKASEFHPGRDLFRFGAAPKPPAPKPKPKPQQAPVQPRPAAQVKPPAGPARPTPPTIDVTFVGSFGESESPIAVFTDGKGIYNAFVGDLIKDKFRVHQIGLESVDLAFVGFPDEPPARLPIGG